MRGGIPVPVTTRKMRKVLICLAIGATLVLEGCSSAGEKSEYDTSALEQLPFVYRMTVQQGNIVTEEMVDRLEPGMTKSQVRYVLGTPLVADIFHDNRWDYTYTIRRGHQPMEVKPLTIYFEDDELVRIEGYIRPDPERAAEREPQDLLVTVPNWSGEQGLLRRALTKMGLEPAD
jgi:outer membrane protein assembly factor BamE